ncbi:MAG TPA: DUF4169 family protein [Saliniramus sp.]|nr:DUF4169 family protein [Saliniramus sp.]
MTGDVVNLRLARKRKAREEAEAAASANRTKFGRSKQEKQLTSAIREIETQRIEGKRLERSENTSDEPQ